MGKHQVMARIGLFCLLFLCAPSLLAIVYVDRDASGTVHDGRTWDTAYETIQQGVNDAIKHGHEVWVANGVYSENVAMARGVTLYGGFLGAEPGGHEISLDQRDFVQHVATIDGHQAGSCVVMAVGAQVDGFRLTNGTGRTLPGYGTNRVGGAVLCHLLEDSGVIANNTIDNSTAYYGGGIFCRISSPAIVGNTISRNTATYGAGIYCYLSSPHIDGNTISNNTMTSAGRGGGGVCCDYNSCPAIEHNVFTGNSAGNGYGGGIFCRDRSAATVVGNTFSGDSAGNHGGAISASVDGIEIRDNVFETCAAESGGAIDIGGSASIQGNVIRNNTCGLAGAGIYVGSGSPIIADNLIVGNTSGNPAFPGGGGGIYSQNADPIIVNNTMCGNSANYGGRQCIFLYGGKVLVANNIVVHNTGGIGVDPDYKPELTSSRNCFYSNVGTNPPLPNGDTNIYVDPLLADYAHGDLRLRGNSPCIDTGDNAAAGASYRDLDGNPRICDGNGDGVAVADMGAYEHCTATELTVAPSQCFQPGWNWFSIPLTPVNPGASAVLGFSAENVVYAWDDLAKSIQIFPDDFADLAIGLSYLAYLDVWASPSFVGIQPTLPFERTLPSAGWSWVGVPSTQAIASDDLRVCKGGLTRTPTVDRAAADPWLNWSWIYWDSIARTTGIVSPFPGADDQYLHPWFGYRVWANTENVTIQFP